MECKSMLFVKNHIPHLILSMLAENVSDMHVLYFCNSCIKIKLAFEL